MRTSIFLASMLAVAPLHAANDQVRRAPAPAWATPSEPMPVPQDASGLVFVRRSDSLVHFDAQGHANYVGYRIKILHANALQLGNLSLAWSPSSGAPTVHVIKVHRGGEAIDILKNAAFEILRREDQLEAASLDGVLTAVLRIPDLRVGDEIEVELTTPISDPTLGPNDSGLLLVSPDPPPGRFRLGLSWADGHKPRLQMTPDMAALAKTGERSVRLDFDNPAMLAPPQDAPGRYSWQRVLEYSDFADWSAISRHFAPLYARAGAIEAGSPLKEEARRIAATHSTPLERASAALKLVQQEVRYVYVGLNGGNLTPASAAETWKRRYGDCKGKTALLLGLLAELGIEAEPVLVSNSGGDDGLDQRLPSPRLFDHVLVRARIGGSDHWLDGTLPPVATPSPAPVLPYRWVLPITARGSAIQHREWRPAERPDSLTLYEIDARAGFEKPARITATTIVRGIAGLQQQVQYSGIARSQLLSTMRQQMIGDTWQTVDDVRWGYDSKAQASILTISGNGAVDWDDSGGGARSLALPGGGFSPPDRRMRPPDQNQDAPYYTAPEFDCHVTTVRLPEATKVGQWSFNSTFDTRIFGRQYYRSFDLRDGALRMIRGSRVEKPEIDAATAKRENARIAAFDNSMAWASYDPSRSKPARRSDRSVPATYEIDWTADSVPCLPSAAGG